jgi:hypothetical protein
MTMFDPRTTPRPEIRKRDVVVRKGTEQPRGIVVLGPLPIEDAELRGLRSAPVGPGWYVLVMWHNRKRLVAELADGLTRVGNLDSDE